MATVIETETKVSKSIAKRSFPLYRIFELLALRNNSRLPKLFFFIRGTMVIAIETEIEASVAFR